MAWAGDDSKKNTALLKKQYATYKTALASGKILYAKTSALEVWETSERTLGEAKQTGDFAYNFAALGRVSAGNKRDKTTEKAFQRSLELASLHGDKAGATTVTRQIEFAKYQSQIGRNSKAHGLLQQAEALAQSSNLKGTKTLRRFDARKVESILST